MKKMLCTVAAATVLSMAARACDVCGCGVSNQYLGMLPQYRWNFIGFQSQYNLLSTNHPGLASGDPSEQSNERYLTSQLWGRYNLGSHYQVFAFVPYHYNTHIENGVTSTAQGVGDISLLLSRSVLNGVGSQYKHTLIAGAGIKLPTGSYKGATERELLGLPNIQPGTGSWDGLVNVNYTVQKDRVGANVDASYTLTTTDKESHKYGNKLSTGALLFYTISARRLTILPQVGARYEYSLHDYDNYAKRWLNEQSGGYLCYGSAGVQLYYGRVGARMSYLLPVAQHYSSGYVTAGSKYDAGVYLLF